MSVLALGVIGLVEGGGDPGRFFGGDWSAVDWPAVATMLLITAIIAVILLPIAYRILPHELKRVGTAFTALAVIAPLGLIAPGFAYGEGSTEDVEAAFGYVPQGLQDLSSIFSAPFAGYNLPLPFFSDANAQLWQAAIGYEIAGIIGVLLIGAVIVLIARLIRGRPANRPADQPHGATV